MIQLDEKQTAVILAESPTLINASAGSGKTRCLIAKIIRLIEQGASPSSICAITFTNRAANEMNERLKSQCTRPTKGIQMSTIHSLCVRIMKNFIDLTPLKLPFSIYDGTDQLSVVKTIVKSRGYSGEPKDYIGTISYIKSICESSHPDDIKKALQKKEDSDLHEEQFLKLFKTYQNILWKNNACDFDDLLIYAYGCLKNKDCAEHFSNVWHHILVDEFQDTSVIQYKIINQLYNSKKTETLFVVGDFNQCVTEETKISGIPVTDISKGDMTVAAAGNGSLNVFPIENKFKRHVKNKPVITITTESGKELTTTYEHSHFAGYHPKFSNEKYFTYLMYKENLGYRVGVTSMIRHMGKNGSILGFKLRLGQERADYLWLLGAYDTRAEAKYYEQLYSIKYGLPTWIFFTKNRGLKIDYNEYYIKKLFKTTDTEKSAKKLLKNLNLFFEKPHHIPKCMNKKRRRNFSIRLCAQKRYSKNLPSYHRFMLSGSEIKDKELLKKHGFNVRKAKGKRGYKIEGISTNLSEIYDLAEKINKILPLNIIESAKFSSISLPMTPASHVLPGMVCFVEEYGKIKIETITKVKKHTYTGYIHDLNVGQVHNYIANGIITHNSIYGFRNARPENMNDFIKRYEPTVCNLSYNYRCGSTIITHANKFLQFGVPMVSKSQVTGQVSFSRFDNGEDEAEKIANALLRKRDYENTAILFRVNTRSLLFERAFAKKRVPYKIVGALPYYRRKVAKDMLSYLKASTNRSDLESLVRIVNNPKRKFGNQKQEQLLHKGWPYLEETAEQMPAIKRFIEILDSIKNQTPYDAVNEVLFETEYRNTLKRDSDHTMLTSFIDVASGYDTIEDLILASTFLEEDSGHGVKLMTAHASKGLEFDTVLVVGVEEGLWPHRFSKNLAEESRLFFVAISRAKKYLNISYSKSRLNRGKAILTFPSPLFKKLIS